MSPAHNSSQSSFFSLGEAVKRVRENSQGLLLYFLPLPFLPALFISLLRGAVVPAVANLAALFLILLGGGLTRRGLANERAYEKKSKAMAPRPPWKIIGGLCVGAGVGIGSLLSVGNGLVFSIFLALLALLGFYLAYGLDPLRDKGMVVRSSGFRDSEVGKIIAEAEGKIADMEKTSQQLTNPELRSRLDRVTSLSRNILLELERDPDDLRLARKFLTVYLDSARKVSLDYVNTSSRAEVNELEQRFSEVLISIEDVFGELHQKMLANDLLDLDVQMEVLQNRLKREGM